MHHRKNMSKRPRKFRKTMTYLKEEKDKKEKWKKNIAVENKLE